MTADGATIEWLGLDGDWHPAILVGPVDDDRCLIELERGALIVAVNERVRGRVRAAASS